MQERRDEILKVKETALTRSVSTRVRWASHIKMVHNEIPASTCHKCLTFQAGLQMDHYLIEEIDAKLKSIS